MKQATLKSAPLICGALLASIAAFAEPAEATVIPGVSQITVSGQWNDHAGNVYTAIGPGPHTFGGAATTYPGSNFPTFTVTVTSGLSTRPGWQNEIVLNFNNFGLFNNPPNIYWDTQLVIKQLPNATPITNFQVKNGAGTVLPLAGATGNPTGLQTIGSTNGGTITISNLITAFNLATDDRLIIQWNQQIIPAPGAMALLGLAGFVGGARRRRQPN